MLRPWASSWLQPLRDKYPSGWLYTRQPEMTVDYHQQLWVAWEFGDRALVENTLQDMILNLNAWQFHGREPPDLLEKAQEVSQKAVAGMYAMMKDAVDQLLPAPGATAQTLPNKCRHNDRSCHFKMLGSLMTSLASCGFWPVTTGTPNVSIRTLLLALSLLTLENHVGIIQDTRPIDILGSSKSVSSSNHNTTALGQLPCTFSTAGISNRYGERRNPLYRDSGIFGSPFPTVVYRPEPQGSYASNHTSCHPMPKGYDELQKACSILSIQLNESHLKHLRTQAAKTGI
ncbi:hypothetical protein BJ166DRAFT_352163 [Pestalotiopsis sp. NC0098]|nr:hypothetical protein BJ166DRAFT_352163 [Pestalotiopsis sp. NC0098]